MHVFDGLSRLTSVLQSTASHSSGALFQVRATKHTRKPLWARLLLRQAMPTWGVKYLISSQLQQVRVIGNTSEMSVDSPIDDPGILLTTTGKTEVNVQPSPPHTTMQVRPVQ